MRSLGLPVALLLLALTAAPAAAATEGTSALQVCGTLREHRAATTGAAGSLSIGTRTYAVAPGTVAGNGGVSVAIGSDLCVQATQGISSGRLVYVLFFPLSIAADGRVCGNALRSTGSTVTLAADFGELTLATSSGAPAQGRERVCYATTVDRTTGDLTATGSLPVRDVDRERIAHCGTVSSYTPATTASSGYIAIGSRSYRIAAGVAYTGDPAGDRTDRTAVGSPMCLHATLGTAGEILGYLTGGIPPTTGGVVIAYVPPVGATSGVATLSYASRATLRIPAAIEAAVDLGRGGSHCFRTTVDATGDQAAAAVIACPQGVATGPGPAQTTASPSAAPSVRASLGASPGLSPTPPPTAPAHGPSPSDEAGVTTTRVGPDPLLVLVAMALGALGIATVLLARRRR